MSKLYHRDQRLEEAMSSFAMCNATDCEWHDGGGCTCYTVDLVKKSIGDDKYIVICADYEQRVEDDNDK